jgi:hypothetical protein
MMQMGEIEVTQALTEPFTKSNRAIIVFREPAVDVLLH